MTKVICTYCNNIAINIIFAAHKNSNHKKMNQKLNYILGLFCLLVLFSCKKEPETPTIPNEEEVITTLTYTLTPTCGCNTVTLKFVDLDGDGGNNPIITTDTLKANTIYNGTLVLLNETENPAEDITEEVKEEGQEHQFFFVSTASGVSVAYDDQDSDGRPIGIQTILNSLNASKGTLKVILRHEPNKSANGVSNGDPANAGGETDIEVEFPIVIQ